jgi:hypothetical protein
MLRIPHCLNNRLIDGDKVKGARLMFLVNIVAIDCPLPFSLTILPQYARTPFSLFATLGYIIPDSYLRRWVSLLFNSAQS